jgi:hypothetical protein
MCTSGFFNKKYLRPFLATLEFRILYFFKDIHFANPIQHTFC